MKTVLASFLAAFLLAFAPPVLALPASVTSVSSNSTASTLPNSTISTSLTSTTTPLTVLSTSTTSTTSTASTTSTTSMTSMTSASLTSSTSSAASTSPKPNPTQDLADLSIVVSCFDLRQPDRLRLTANCVTNQFFGPELSVQKPVLVLDDCLVNRAGTLSHHGTESGGGFTESCGPCDLSGPYNATLTCPCHKSNLYDEPVLSRFDLGDWHYFQYNQTTQELTCDYLPDYVTGG
ncbi:hypothetical protein GGR53DRAFT_260272 [Hypoxylon sp. FL1150]|nr:hypothetical protein GGR53DRAFT_260272 [Hypoxylon sp. FL1150]